MAKKITTAAFDIVDPPSNCLLGASFGVYGNCPALANSPTPTITVELTLNKQAGGAAVTLSQTATTDPTARTWEAYFDGVPASTINSGKIIAHCSAGGTQTAPSDNLSIASVVQAGLDVDSPINGETVTGPIGPFPFGPLSAKKSTKNSAKKSMKKSAKVAASAVKAKGKHLAAATVTAYVTKKGKRLKATDTPVTSGPPVGGKKNWELKLDDLFNAQVTSGRFGLHYRIKNGTKTHRISRGSFVVS